MTQDQTKKEALFNEVKGSLFEYLVCKQIAIKSNEELLFQQSLDKNYLTVLSQQDRMVRQFYPEMLSFLYEISVDTTEALIEYLKEIPTRPKVVGKFSNSAFAEDYHEADMMVSLMSGPLPVSLKLNKKNAYVNTKSGGIKSFFTQYFSFIDQDVQKYFNQFVDLEFHRMGHEVHAHHDLDYVGDFNLWVKTGHSELPGELDTETRNILKRYYARIASEMHSILSKAFISSPDAFKASLPPLLGFGSEDILQVICFHEFAQGRKSQVEIHSFQEMSSQLPLTSLKPFSSISSVEFDIGDWSLHVRVKPMNKFTTTAIKVNCSVKVKRPASS